MTDSTRLPAPLASWRQTLLSPLKPAQDASYPRENSPVWKVIERTGDHYLNVAPKPVLSTRETRAYREAIPHPGHGNAPALKDSSADLLALILTAVDGEPLKGEEPPACRRAAHRHAGQLLRRFHEALPGLQAQVEAAQVVENAQSGLDKHIAQAGDQLATGESDMSRRVVSTLLSDAEECALGKFAAADAASALAYGPRCSEAFVTARGRATVERLMQEGRR
ncbi:aminoglycoside phosphotransferase [Streptomyces sp. NPDC096311]|uniref:aminoglycoside phosphotransferase n=1 Tax=Streptomyces sp. NPDC096311 TaxID=3366083 RepID=UPI00382BD451